MSITIFALGQIFALCTWTKKGSFFVSFVSPPPRLRGADHQQMRSSFWRFFSLLKWIHFAVTTGETTKSYSNPTLLLATENKKGRGAFDASSAVSLKRRITWGMAALSMMQLPIFWPSFWSPLELTMTMDNENVGNKSILISMKYWAMRPNGVEIVVVDFVFDALASSPRGRFPPHLLPTGSRLALACGARLSSMAPNRRLENIMASRPSAFRY